MKTLPALLLAGLMAGSSALRAEPPAAPSAPLPGLSLDAAFAAALKQSEALASQQELVTQAEERYKQAVGNVLPSVSASALWFFQDTRQLPAGPGQPTGQEETYKVSADQPLFRGLREYAALRQTKGTIAYQKLASQSAALQLYSDTSQAYYMVAALEKDLATQSGEMDLYAKRISELQDFVRIGRSRETEILSVQSAQAILKAQIEQSKALVAAAREVLSFLTGLDADTPLNDQLSTPSSVDSLDSYLSHISERPDVKAASANIDLMSENVNIAEGGHLPDADLSGNYYFQRPPGSTQDTYWDAQISLNFPIFSGGIVLAQTREAQSQVRQAQLSLQQQQRSAAQDIRTAYKNLHYDLAQAQAFNDAYAIAEKNYKAESGDYNNGLVTNLELLEALTAYQDTQRSLDKAIYAAKTDYAKLQALAAQISIPDNGDK